MAGVTARGACMLISMTGYGYGESSSDLVKIQVELKCVNNRFLDVQLRVPREYMALEHRISALLRESFSRGRVDVHLRRSELKPLTNQVRINSALVREYHHQLLALKHEFGLDGNVSLDLLMRLDGVVGTVDDGRDPEAEWSVVRDAVKLAASAALEMKQKEGESLRTDLLQRHVTLCALLEEMSKHSGALAEQLQARLTARVRDALARLGAGPAEESRLLQEVVYYADRVDISEELTRFGSHLDQLKGLLSSREAVGRKIEFLLQELLREANTIGSKTATPEISRCGMLVKVELEKIREQIQNIE